MSSSSSSLAFIKNVVFEMVFVLTSDNKWIGQLDLLAFFVEYVQLLSFALSYDISWGAPEFQESLSYVILPWKVTPVSFWIITTIAALAIGILLLLFHQVYNLGGVRSIKALKFGRLLMSVFSTIMFFPILKTWLGVFQVALGQSKDPLIDATTSNITIAAVMIILFYVTVLFFSFLYMIPDPLETKEMTARVTTRPVVFDFLGRTIIVVTKSLLEDRVLLSSIYWIVMMITLIGNLIYPYYLQARMNYLKIGLAGSLWFLANFKLYASIWPQNDTRLLTAALCLCILVIPLFAAISFFRMRRLNPCYFGRELPEDFFTRLHLVTDFELAARFYTFDRADLYKLMQGVKIYEQGLRRYPKSNFLHARFAIFLAFVLKERLNRLITGDEKKDREYITIMEKVSSQTRSLIKRTFRMKPMLDLQYCFFYVATKLEQQEYAEEAGKDKMDVMESIRFKHDIHRAFLHHRQANEAILSVWRVAKTRDFNTKYQMYRLTELFKRHTTQAEWYYKRLVTQFPHSEVAWQRYIKFVKDVMNQEKQANELQENYASLKAKHLQEKTMILGSLGSFESAGGGSTLQDTISATLGKRQTSNTNSGKWHVRAKNLFTAMIICKVVLFFGLIFMFQYSTGQFLISVTSETTTIGGTRRTGQSILYDARRMEILTNFGPQYLPTRDNATTILRDIRSSATQMNEVFIKLRQSPTFKNDNQLYGRWNNKEVEIYTRSRPTVKKMYKTDIGTLYSLFTSHAKNFSSANPDNFVQNPLLDPNTNITTSLIKSTNWLFLMDNGWKEFIYHQDQLVDAFAQANERKITKDQIILLTIFGIVVGIPILLAIILVLPSYFSLRNESYTVISYFYDFDADILDYIIGKHRQISQEMDSGMTKSQSQTSFASTSVTSFSFSEDFSAMYFMTRIASSPPHTKMLMVYIITVLTFIGILVSILMVSYNTGNFLFYGGPEANMAASRRYLTRRIMSLSQELIRGDSVVWNSRDQIRAALLENVDQLYERNQGIKYGSVKLHLPGLVGRYPPMDALIFNRKCDSIELRCASFDEKISLLIQNAYALSNVSDDHLSYFDQRYLDICELALTWLRIDVETAVTLLNAEVVPRVEMTRMILTILFCLSIPIGIIAVYTITRMKNVVVHSIDSTRKLLNMVPYEHLKRYIGAHKYLKTAKIIKSHRTTDVDIELNNKDKTDKLNPQQAQNVETTSFKGLLNKFVRKKSLERATRPDNEITKSREMGDNEEEEKRNTTSFTHTEKTNPYNSVKEVNTDRKNLIKDNKITLSFQETAEFINNNQTSSDESLETEQQE